MGFSKPYDKAVSSTCVGRLDNEENRVNLHLFVLPKFS